MVENRDNESRAPRRKGAGRAAAKPGFATGGAHAVRTTKPKDIFSADRSGLDVPCFWPLCLPQWLTRARLDALRKNLAFVETVHRTHVRRPAPEWSTSNAVRLALHTLQLRDFSRQADGPFTMVVAPYAGHSSTIADFRKGQSLVETLLDHGLGRLCVTDWKNASEATKNYDIDNYLAELNVCVDELGGSVNLIGLCQGGWLSAMYAARFPAKVRTLVLAGAPIDTDAGEGPVKDYAHTLPTAFYERLVKLGGGMLKGEFMLTGFKSMHPDTQYVAKFHDLYRNIDDPEHRRRFEEFERWYEHTLDLPGVWYLQVITQLFKQNRLAKGEFVGLGRQLKLKDVTCPVYLLAGEVDDVTPREQVFNAETYLGTPRTQIIKEITPGGHIGLFMGKETLAAKWPGIAAWIQRAA